MQKRRLKIHSIPMLLLAALTVMGIAQTALATTSSSENYQVTEAEFGSSLSQEGCSDQYCARASIGDVASGQSQSPSLSATFGSITSDEPVLEVIVDPGESNLGVLSTERTATKTTVIRIRSYLSEGYVLQIVGDPPKYGNHTLRTPTTPSGSIQGTEQFAINAVKNTIPDVGANPEQIPSNQTSFGEVEDDYRTPNMFKYVSGDVIAKSLSESGRTDYTVSMIVNISNATPAGRYSGDLSAVVIPFY